MCWMQFDDVMDDLEDEIFRYKKQAAKLTEKLKELGITDFTPPEELKDLNFREGHFMQEAFEAMKYEEKKWAKYIKALENRIKEYEAETNNEKTE